MGSSSTLIGANVRRTAWDTIRSDYCDWDPDYCIVGKSWLNDVLIYNQLLLLKCTEAAIGGDDDSLEGPKKLCEINFPGTLKKRKQKELLFPIH
ncbi:hypothetical protein H0E87_004763 [Populus deltoides]|uniref:Uncharacterized protein n=1 Tax=Populus deltoides TaxID=3696 RepID=A0A8T2ZGH3_POPDE|nr:hypothetical protein H0E87_004763 [Populus deltoides]